MTELAQTRRKWNLRYAEKMADAPRPEPHPLALEWGSRFIGGRVLDAACGLGRGIATAGERFREVFAVDLSDVAVREARALWQSDSRIRWIVADVTQLPWPRGFFGLVCAFGFTDLPFFSRLGDLLAPGGMVLYQGFSARQLEVKPGLAPEWTATPEALHGLFAGWEILACRETDEPPFRISLAAVNPAEGNRA